MKYKLSCDFAGYNTGDIIKPCQANDGYFNHAGSKYGLIHIDIIKALPEIFIPVPEKKKVYIGIGDKKTDGVYKTSYAFENKELIESWYINPQIIETEIEVKE